eukprot:g2161.t1
MRLGLKFSVVQDDTDFWGFPVHFSPEADVARRWAEHDAALARGEAKRMFEEERRQRRVELDIEAEERAKDRVLFTYLVSRYGPLRGELFSVSSRPGEVYHKMVRDAASCIRLWWQSFYPGVVQRKTEAALFMQKIHRGTGARRLALDRRRKEENVKRMARRIIHRHVVASWQSWVAYTNKSVRIKALFLRAVGPLKMEALHAWADVVAGQREENQRRLHAAGKMWIHQKLARPWNAWSGTVRRTREVKRMIARHWGKVEGKLFQRWAHWARERISARFEIEQYGALSDRQLARRMDRAVRFLQRVWRRFRVRAIAVAILMEKRQAEHDRLRGSEQRRRAAEDEAVGAAAVAALKQGDVARSIAGTAAGRRALRARRREAKTERRSSRQADAKDRKDAKKKKKEENENKNKKQKEVAGQEGQDGQQQVSDRIQPLPRPPSMAVATEIALGPAVHSLALSAARDEVRGSPLLPPGPCGALLAALRGGRPRRTKQTVRAMEDLLLKVALEAAGEGRVRFRRDRPPLLACRAYDPATGKSAAEVPLVIEEFDDNDGELPYSYGADTEAKFGGQTAGQELSADTTDYAAARGNVGGGAKKKQRKVVEEEEEEEEPPPCRTILRLGIMRAQGLAKADAFSESDPYAAVDVPLPEPLSAINVLRIRIFDDDSDEAVGGGGGGGGGAPIEDDFLGEVVLRGTLIRNPQGSAVERGGGSSDEDATMTFKLKREAGPAGKQQRFVRGSVTLRFQYLENVKGQV